MCDNEVLLTYQTREAIPSNIEDFFRKKTRVFYRHIFVGGVEYKHCSTCGDWLPLESFTTARSRWDLLSNRCKNCEHTYQNLGYVKSRAKNWFKEYRKTNPEYFIRYNKEYREKNKEKVNKQNRCNGYLRYHTKQKYNVSYILNRTMKDGIWSSLKGSKRGRKWTSLVPYTVNDLKRHLERQFQEGMSWDNYGKGKGKWNIDHKRSISSFRITDTDSAEFKECWSLNNLRPLWSLENSSKGRKCV